MIIPDEKIEYNIKKSVPDDTFDESIPFSEQLSAAFTIDNVVGSFLSQKKGLPDEYVANPEYSPLDDLTEEERQDEDFLGKAAMADSLGELDALREQTAMERNARSKLDGVSGVAASIVAGLLDPTNLIPVGGATYKAYKTGNILKGGIYTGLATGGAVTVQESLLHATQTERTLGESALNVTGAMLLGGALGVGVSLINKGVMSKAARETEELFDAAPEIKPEFEQVPEGSGTAGAASVYDDIQVKGTVARKAMEYLKFIDPTARLATGSKAARQVNVRLTENPLEMEGAPVRPSVEQRARGRQQALYGRGLNDHLDVFSEMRKSGSRIKKRDFNALVAKEVRNPGSTGNPYAKKSADKWVKEVYTPIYKDMQKLGLMGDEAVETAQRYLNRKWNKEIVIGELPKFIDTVSKWLTDNQEIDLDDAKELANEIAARIIGTPEGVLPYDKDLRPKGSGGKAGLRSPFKSRDFKIDDSLVEDFLDNDIEQLAFAHLRQTTTDLELVREFGGPNVSIEDAINLTPQEKAIENEYSRLMDKAKTAKERQRLNKAKDMEIKALMGIRDRLRGQYDLPEGTPSFMRRFNSSARDLNYVRLLGGVVASSIPDMAKTVMAEGFIRAFGSGLLPLVQNIGKMKPIKADVRYFGIGLETITSGRVEAIADINDYALGGTKLERGIKAMANTFGKVSLMDYWNDSMKMAHALAMQSRVADDFAKGNYKSLERLGVDEGTAERIGKMVKKHGTKEGRVQLFNGKNWEDQDAAMSWAIALRKESDRVIIVPGQEKPLMMSNDVGKTILQFRSFMMSSTQRTLLASMQGQDRNALGGALLMIGLGSMSYAFKQWDAGREISDDPKVWVTEGIDRSGALGVIMEANNTIEKFSSNRVGLRPLLGVGQPASRFASRSQAENLLGPTYGSFLNSSLSAANALTSEYDWTEADSSNVRRLLPYQNLTFMRRGFDAIEEYIHEGVTQ